MPFCIKKDLLGISPSNNQIMIAHLLHWTQKPGAATRAFRAACKKDSFTFVYSNCPNLFKGKVVAEPQERTASFRMCNLEVKHFQIEATITALSVRFENKNPFQPPS